MEVDEMEIDGAVSLSEPPVMNKNALFVCYISKDKGLKRVKIYLESFEDLTMDDLKSAVMTEMNTWDWEGSDDIPTHVDLMHCSRILMTEDDVKKVRPLSVVTVLNKERLGANPLEEKHKSEDFISSYAKSRNIHEQLRSCSIALKTAFLNPKFVEMVENLADSEMLENVFAVVPELKHDPVAVGIIQDPSLIFHLSDPESLKRVANTKPWIIEAFNFIAASVHQEKGGEPSAQGLGHLFGAGLFDGEDESMDEGDDDDDMPGPSQRGSVITREQLSAALSALGGGPRGGGGLGAVSNSFGGLFQPPAQPNRSQASSASSNPSPGVATAGANIQNLMNNLASAAGGTPGQPLNSDMVARAITSALRRLTPEQRADQLNAIRHLASTINQPTSPSQPATTPPSQPTPASPVTPPVGSGMSALAQQYASQLRQMRDLGITDERLSILALRVSEGDVNTAAELVFSGWQGEGSDPI